MKPKNGPFRDAKGRLPYKVYIGYVTDKGWCATIWFKYMQTSFGDGRVAFHWSAHRRYKLQGFVPLASRDNLKDKFAELFEATSEHICKRVK
mgnify:FL=1